MKKHFSVISSLLLLLLSAACSSDEVQLENPAKERAQSSLRTVDEAIEIARNLHALRHPSRQVAEVADVEVIGSQASRSTTDLPFQLGMDGRAKRIFPRRCVRLPEAHEQN